MQENFVEKYFINASIEEGIRAYLSAKEGNGYKRIYTYEMYIIKALTIIYGEKSILLPYKIDNELAFKCNLLMYGLKESDMEYFIKLMDDYYDFMSDYKSERKATGIINEIETILIKMINKKSRKYPFTQEELNEFDTIFNPIRGELRNIKQLVSNNQGLIIREWETQRSDLSNTQLRLRAINPNLLNSSTYYKYGYDIKTIAELSSKEIDEINNIIVKEENKVEIKSNDVKIKSRLVLTTGHVLLDILIVFSMIATAIMLAVVSYGVFGG